MREIEAHTADVSPNALARHFIRRSDVMAAKALPISAELRAKIDENYGFIDTDDSVRAQYEKIGATHTDVFQASAQEPRYVYVRDWLRARPRVGHGAGLRLRARRLLREPAQRDRT